MIREAVAVERQAPHYNSPQIIQSFYKAGIMTDPILEKSSFEARDRHVYLDLPLVTEENLGSQEL